MHRRAYRLGYLGRERRTDLQGAQTGLWARFDPDDPDACNPYAELQFPDEVYESIQEYREERA